MIKINLLYQTPVEWSDVILSHFDAFLQDHANCERKASALALSMVMKYADKTKLIPPLIELAQEELEHFRQVYQIMEKRGLSLGAEMKDPYVNQLLEHCRQPSEDRFVDRFLIYSIVETRGAERFRLIAEALSEPELKLFYHKLWGSEAKHGQLFLRLLLEYNPSEVVYPRLEYLLQKEATIVQNLEWRASLH